MILEAGATYWGLSDTVEVVAWVEEDDGTDLYRRLISLEAELMHTDNVMLSITAGPEHYSKDLDEEKGSFRFFFLHPPIQHHQYLKLTATLNDDRTASMTTNVMTEKMLKRRGELGNPDFGGRGAIAYPLPIEEEQA
jgi:hypothetical protein